MSHDTLEGAAATFLAVRDRLFSMAFRILNNFADAEDIVQDAWLRWQTCDRSAVLDPQAFLATITKRLCINALQSARSRHETYFGPWLPEPVDAAADPLRTLERREPLQSAALTLLERLTGQERAAYVLREAFDFSYAEIATNVGVSPANARQLVSRARRRIAAAQQGDVATLARSYCKDIATAA